MRGALLEDDPEVARVMAAWVGDAGHQVVHFTDGSALLKELRRESFDFFLLDWQVPGVGGDEVLRRLRHEMRVDAPVIFVTARDAEEDVASVLQGGADDFIRKPVRRRELVARIEAVARRRAPARMSGVLQVGRYAIDLDARQVRLDGAAVELSEMEYELAAFLFARADGLVSRGHVAQSVWGHNDAVVSRTLDVHISKIRRKLALGPEHGLRLATIYGFGYRLERCHDDNG